MYTDIKNMSKLLWKPDNKVIENANITKFIKYINNKHKLNITDYYELYDFSVNELDRFWEAIWEYSNIVHSVKYDSIVTDADKFPPITKWFAGAELNFAENLLRYRDDNIAILFKSETDEEIKISYKELYNRVSKVYNSLKSFGIKKGDRIAGYMPNIPETIIAMLATTALGAVWSSCGAELGADAALDRLGQIEPRILFTVDAYPYKGRQFDLLAKVREVANNISSIEKTVVLNYMNDSAEISEINNSILWNVFESDISRIEFTQVDFEHPLYIMFSSGTTGKPKCMVQSVGGVLINHLKELILHTDVKRDDTLFYISSPSWMMWNWMTSGLATGLTLALYDGNPLYPDWKAVWKFIDEYNITIFGCSASYLHYLKSIGARPNKEFELNALREISQTGSALSDEGFDFVYQDIKSNLHFNSISGGTDINGCFAAGVPILPVYSGQLQVRALGMRVNAFDDGLNPVFDQQGELVCELASPSMPIYFWKDDDNKKYNNAYFNFYKGKKVWRHGDYIEIYSKTGGVTFYGRSDSVLKPSGVRIGTAEIYNVVEEISGIADSLAIGQQYDNDQRIILFVTLTEGNQLDDNLKDRIKSELRNKASPRHVPSLILKAPDIPYTFSGKKVESAITNIIHGRDVSNEGAMRNPECLKFYRAISDELNS